MNNLIGLKALREDVNTYIAAVRKGRSFIVVRRSKPIFKISPPDTEELWEVVVDFTKIKKGGAALEEVLSRL